MRTKIIAGNWKMHKDLPQTESFFNEFAANLPETTAEVIIAPPFTSLGYALENTKNTCIEIAAQNVHSENEGAFTGEISPLMLKSIGIKKVIIGHSERREYFYETDEVLAQKARNALQNGLEIIFCIGEKLNDRKNNTHFQVIKYQLEKGLFSLPKEAWNHIVIAYEPVWAIGTGETASPEQAQEMHTFIRKTIAENYDNEIANTIRILYGGSVKPDNAHQLFSKPDVDGGLIGGASLNPQDFIKIIFAAE